MTNIQEAIVNNCREKWLKTAWVIYAARDQLSLPDENESYDLIEHQLMELVQKGELLAAGDLSDWRASEVRLPVTR